jgi:Xaa-Pro dipeptidase
VYTTDGEQLFRQEAYFHYLFGVNEDGFWGALDVRNVSCFLAEGSSSSSSKGL